MTKETPDVFKKLIDMKIDSFCTDYPLEVVKIRDEYLLQKKSLFLEENGPILEEEDFLAETLKAFWNSDAPFAVLAVLSFSPL